jgi:hypothetical protein
MTLPAHYPSTPLLLRKVLGRKRWYAPTGVLQQDSVQDSVQPFAPADIKGCSNLSSVRVVGQPEKLGIGRPGAELTTAAFLLTRRSIDAVFRTVSVRGAPAGGRNGH